MQRLSKSSGWRSPSVRHVTVFFSLLSTTPSTAIASKPTGRPMSLVTMTSLNAKLSANRKRCTMVPVYVGGNVAGWFNDVIASPGLRRQWPRQSDGRENGMISLWQMVSTICGTLSYAITALMLQHIEPRTVRYRFIVSNTAITKPNTKKFELLHRSTIGIHWWHASFMSTQRIRALCFLVTCSHTLVTSCVSDWQNKISRFMWNKTWFRPQVTFER